MTSPPAGSAEAFHRSLPKSQPTPLRSLPGIAAELGLAQLSIKDEAQRLGLNSFKALGATWAVARRLGVEVGLPFPSSLEHLREVLELRRLRVTLTTASAGNHGRAVARAARMLHQRAVVFVPAATEPWRVVAIENEGAEVRQVGATYDEAVAECARVGGAEGWTAIADTALTPLEVVPRWISQGYLTLFDELGSSPGFTHVVIQAGVGALALAALWWADSLAPRPKLIIVEPLAAAGLMASAQSADGALTVADGSQVTTMVGLNCATPSPVAWPSLRTGIDALVAIDDAWTLSAQRMLAAHRLVVSAGESGAAGLGGLLALRNHGELRAALGLDETSCVLTVNTESA